MLEGATIQLNEFTPCKARSKDLFKCFKSGRTSSNGIDSKYEKQAIIDLNFPCKTTMKNIESKTYYY